MPVRGALAASSGAPSASVSGAVVDHSAPIPDPTLDTPTDVDLELFYDPETGAFASEDGGITGVENALQLEDSGALLHALLEVDLPADTIYLWTGEPSLVMDGNTYLASRVIAVSGEGSSLVASGGVQVQVTGITAADRRVFLTDVKSPVCRFKLIGSEDGGASWVTIGRVRSGRMSAPVLQGGTFTFEIAPVSPQADRGRTLYWSHEDRVRTVGAVDQGMSQMALLAGTGVLGNWPLVSRDPA